MHFKNAYLLTTVESGRCKYIVVSKSLNSRLSSYSPSLAVNNNDIFKLIYHLHHHHHTKSNSEVVKSSKFIYRCGYQGLSCTVALIHITLEQRFSNCGPRTTSRPRVLPLWSYQIEHQSKKDRKNKINVNCVSHTIVENLKQSLEITYNKRL